MGMLLMATSATRLQRERTVGAQVVWEAGISSRPDARWAHRLARTDTGGQKPPGGQSGVVTREGSTGRRQ